MHMSTSSSGFDTWGDDYIGVILYAKHEYAIIGQGTTRFVVCSTL